jgi:2-methylcitrate dehydratase PrpD
MQDRGFHSTPVFGSLGAAVACGQLVETRRRQSSKPLSAVAASAAGGIHRQQGSMVKPFHAGNSARNGAEAALLASNGFTADVRHLRSAARFLRHLLRQRHLRLRQDDRETSASRII